MQTDPHTREALRLPRTAHERATEPREVLGVDADASIGDDDLGGAVMREGDANLAAARRVLHGIAEEVHEHLLDPRLVHINPQRVRQIDAEAVATLFARRLLVVLDGLAHA